MKNFNGLGYVNCELTSFCNKIPGCWMCGRRKVDKDYPEIATNYGNMDFKLIKKIAKQLPGEIVVASHWNGDPLVYPKLGEALSLFKNQIRVLDTNAILLVKKAKEIINNLDTITISVIENDPLGDEQYEIVKEFIKIKGNSIPRIIYRLLGDVGKLDIGKYQRKCSYSERINRWYKLPGMVATRTLHHPMGSFTYEKKVTVPEIGICQEILGHLAIDRFGDVYPCVRFNPYNYNLLGNVKNDKLIDIWNGNKRKKLIKEHIKGNRNVSKLCKLCQYWGIPIG